MRPNDLLVDPGAWARMVATFPETHPARVAMQINRTIAQWWAEYLMRVPTP
jgi:hypothetical protein